MNFMIQRLATAFISLSGPALEKAGKITAINPALIERLSVDDKDIVARLCSDALAVDGTLLSEPVHVSVFEALAILDNRFDQSLDVRISGQERVFERLKFVLAEAEGLDAKVDTGVSIRFVRVGTSEFFVIIQDNWESQVYGVMRVAFPALHEHLRKRQS